MQKNYKENYLKQYATKSINTKGRIYKEQETSIRTPYQRDRDRIIHSSSFRRLKHKTQVFVNSEGDHYRTRLTHSMEVSQIARTLARSLGLNEDLCETLSLSHDLGHTPFGHAGQDALNKCMRDFGGFEHNLQSLRIVDILEERYLDFPGLNLTFETREGILKHCSKKNALKLGELGERFLNNNQPSLEAQIANVADEIAYNNHDIDDGLRAGLLSFEILNESDFFLEQYEMVCEKCKELNQRQIRHEVVRNMINYIVSDLIETSKIIIDECKPNNVNSVRNSEKLLIKMSLLVEKKHKDLKFLLRKKLYQHEQVNLMTKKAKENGWVVTDDASLFERLGWSVRVLEGSPSNIKVTTRFDLVIAEAALAFRKKEG